MNCPYVFCILCTWCYHLSYSIDRIRYETDVSKFLIDLLQSVNLNQ
jgi:protein-disulfide isomerase-like protein with CxxC motif